MTADRRRALITGASGQDGRYLAKLLLDKGYDVYGVFRAAGVQEGQNDRFRPLVADMADGADVERAVQLAQPDEIYNLGSQSRPAASWMRTDETLMINGMAAARLFEAARTIRPDARIYQASSSEMFGKVDRSPQDEQTPFNPANPYAASKVFAHQMARIYRQGYGQFICNGILFNHESERRPLHFVVQKVAFGAACAALGIENSPELNERGRPVVDAGLLSLGNLDVARDWGHAADFVRAMWLMLQQESPDDYVIGTGELHTLRQLCEVAYAHVELDWKAHVTSDPALARPLETGNTVADPAKARRVLGWTPTITFEKMVTGMVDAQLRRLHAVGGKVAR